MTDTTIRIERFASRVNWEFFVSYAVNFAVWGVVIWAFR